MKCDKQTMLLYAVTDRAWTGKMTLVEQVQAALDGGITCLQLREKAMNDDEFLAEAKTIGELCKKYNIPFIINDNVSVALACGADGIHVGQEDMEAKKVRELAGEDMMIGVSVHTVEEAIQAERDGADYLGLGAVFHTDTKGDAEDMTAEMLKAICDAVSIPTVAIGGISAKNVAKLTGSGVDGIAVVSAIFAAEDPERAASELLALSREMVAASS